MCKSWSPRQSSSISHHTLVCKCSQRKHVYYFSFSSLPCYPSEYLTVEHSAATPAWSCAVTDEECDLVAPVDRAPARCLEGHRFESCRGLRFFLCPTLVTSWFFHFHICFTELNIYHLSPMCNVFCPSHEGSPRQSWTLDSTLWILGSCYWILDSLSVTL